MPFCGILLIKFLPTFFTPKRGEMVTWAHFIWFQAPFTAWNAYWHYLHLAYPVAPLAVLPDTWSQLYTRSVTHTHYMVCPNFMGYYWVLYSDIPQPKLLLTLCTPLELMLSWKTAASKTYYDSMSPLPGTPEQLSHKVQLAPNAQL